MLTQIEWGVQNGPITNNRALPLTTLFFWIKKKNWVEEPLINSWFNVPVTKVSIFVLFLGSWILFESEFSLWVPLKDLTCTLRFLSDDLFYQNF